MTLEFSDTHRKSSPGGVAQLVEALSCTPEGCRFNFWSGHTPWMQDQSLVMVLMGGGQLMLLLHTDFSLSLFQINTHILRSRLKKKVLKHHVALEPWSREGTMFVPRPASSPNWEPLLWGVFWPVMEPLVWLILYVGVSNLRPRGRTHPRMAMNAAQHKIINLLKTL